MSYDDDDDKDSGKSVEQKIVDSIYANDMDELRMLLLEDADLNKLEAYGKKGNEKITPIFIAVSKRNLTACKLLIKMKAKVTVKSFPAGNTPLHIAAQWADNKIVALLLKNGADPVANNNKQKNPLQIIGKKHKMQESDELLEAKMETQILLLTAGSKRADDFQEEIDEGIADAEDGFQALKDEANLRVNKIQKQQNKKFDMTHPYLYVKANRMKAWKSKNKCSVQEYLHKRYIKVKVPQWEDKKNDVTHIDLSRVASFQLAIAKELLLSSGLLLIPEVKPVLPKNAKFKKEKFKKNKK